MYKLITMDMDDTFLNDEMSVSDENKAAVRRAEQAGVKVVVASGRSYASTKQYIKELGLLNLTVSLNGAYIHDPEDDSIVEAFTLETDITQKILKGIEPFHVYTNFSCGEKVFWHGPAEYDRLYSSMNRIQLDYVDSLMELSKTMRAGKILMAAERDKLERIKGLLQEKYGDYVNIAFSKPFFLEVTDKHASKGTAMLEIAKRYGIEPKEIIAIGDSENDLSMIRNAGLGVAVANAAEAIRASADFVTLSNQDNGVAYVINKFIFGENQD